MGCRQSKAAEHTGEVELGDGQSITVEVVEAHTNPAFAAAAGKHPQDDTESGGDKDEGVGDRHVRNDACDPQVAPPVAQTTPLVKADTAYTGAGKSSSTNHHSDSDSDTDTSSDSNSGDRVFAASDGADAMQTADDQQDDGTEDASARAATPDSSPVANMAPRPARVDNGDDEERGSSAGHAPENATDATVQHTEGTKDPVGAAPGSTEQETDASTPAQPRLNVATSRQQEQDAPKGEEEAPLQEDEKKGNRNAQPAFLAADLPAGLGSKLQGLHEIVSAVKEEDKEMARKQAEAEERARKLARSQIAPAALQKLDAITQQRLALQRIAAPEIEPVDHSAGTEEERWKKRASVSQTQERLAGLTSERATPNSIDVSEDGVLGINMKLANLDAALRESASETEDVQAKAQQAEEEARQLVRAQFGADVAERWQRERDARLKVERIQAPDIAPVDRRFATEEERVKAEANEDDTRARLQELSFDFSFN
ncbi:hypothetical protein PTSG_03034 [Salpingoeca rosetta]|uniref:Uncharacterized protein n=1 Tax=Salpingoeca rosetta (strain ATCC 50818 / BSB-021) TaxID=946362 RepID=F2U423_SALR5|nr:uncharacterized protein PTSG_03034 [Salpingoeca rosetta]EGD82367.1 hypothetical protein PTSG_03034 [Salpingoeca rosetta]|eukprot:XP_004996550.1 hypothetical protein PTSG_03034 [Salpingoeca rosetta]